MKKSTRALVGMVALDVLLLAGTAWMVLQVRTRAWSTTVPPEEAVRTITSIAGGAIGVVSGILLVAFFVHRKKGN